MNKLITNQRAYQTLAAYVRGGRLSHALLIEGPAGCGKTTFAGEVAQAALCSAGEPAEDMPELLLGGGAPEPEKPCGQCRDCVKVEKGVHPDVLTFGGEGGSRSFHIDMVRALRQEAYVRPNEAAGKVMILRNTHEMSVQAQNALLKVIEEPPRNVTFLLTCDNRSSMLETIRSRVQVIPLELPTAEQCAAHIAGLQPESDPETIAQACAKAGGNIGRALELLAGDGEDADRAAEVLYNACIGDELAALAALSKYERDRIGLAALLNRMAAVLAEALLRPSGDEKLERLTKCAGRLRLIEILAIIEDTERAVSQNVGGLLLATSLSARIRSVLAEG